MTERLLTAGEVAEYLSVPKSWVYESTRSGAMPCITLGKYRRYRLADVERWLKTCAQPGRGIRLRSTTRGGT